MIIHMSMNIKGFLESNNRKPLKWFDGLATKEDGTPATGTEYIAYLQGELAKGYRLVPVGDCPSFDPQTGCPGHEEGDCE